MYRDVLMEKVVVKIVLKPGGTGFAQKLPNTDSCNAACRVGAWAEPPQYVERGKYDKRGTGRVHK